MFAGLFVEEEDSDTLGDRAVTAFELHYDELVEGEEHSDWLVGEEYWWLLDDIGPQDLQQLYLFHLVWYMCLAHSTIYTPHSELSQYYLMDFVELVELIDSGMILDLDFALPACWWPVLVAINWPRSFIN